VSIDILDEDHSLKLAMRRLAGDEKLRTGLGANARELWQRRFSLRSMAEGYREVLEETLKIPVRSTVPADLPAHLRSSGLEHARRLIQDVTGPSTGLDQLRW
jgi:hypothetical protein